MVRAWARPCAACSAPERQQSQTGVPPVRRDTARATRHSRAPRSGGERISAMKRGLEEQRQRRLAGAGSVRDDAGGGFPRCSALFPPPLQEPRDPVTRRRRASEESGGGGGRVSPIFLARFSAAELGRRPRVTLAETKRNAATPPGAPRKHSSRVAPLFPFLPSNGPSLAFAALLPSPGPLALQRRRQHGGGQPQSSAELRQGPRLRFSAVAHVVLAVC